MKSITKKITVLICALIFSSFQIVAQVNINFLPMSVNDPPFKNPERGVNIFSVSMVPNNYNCYPTYSACGTQYERLEDKNIDQIEFDNNTTVRRAFNLVNFLDGSDITPWYLNNMREDFEFLRENGLKAAINFEYIGVNQRDRTNGSEEFPFHSTSDPGLNDVLKHIDQIGPILRDYNDVIFAFKAGFIGQYGEWFGLNGDDNVNDDFGRPDEYGDSKLGLTTNQWNNRRAVVNRLLSYLPQNKMMELRNPLYKIIMYGDGTTNISGINQITPNDAYNGTTISRLGWHNDGYGAENYYTFYPITQQILDYSNNETKYTAGFAEYAAAVDGWYECDFAINDMEAFHVSHMSPLQDFVKSTIENNWNSNNCYNEILNRLGYRFKMINASLTNTINRGGTMDISINMVNDGFASTINARNVQLVLKHSNGQKWKVNLCEQDPRNWYPNTSISIIEKVGIPSNMVAGTYELFLNLNDPEPSLQNNPAYSIRLANYNVWNATEGYNKLTNIQINNQISNDYNGFQSFQLNNAANCDCSYSDESVTSCRTVECAPYRSISQNFNTPNNRSAIYEINAFNNISSNANVDYSAGEKIVLQPGFRANMGSNFRAHIASCNNVNPLVTMENTIESTNQIGNRILQPEEKSIDHKLFLSIYPNPFQGSTTIHYQLPHDGMVTLSVFDNIGRQVFVLENNKIKKAGIHQLNFDASSLQKGIYFLRLVSEHDNLTQKMMITN